MEKILNSAFDFFAYALPGFCIITSFFILDENLNTSRDFLKLAGEMHVGSGIVLLGLGYAVGFAITPLGRRIYQLLQNTWLIVALDWIFKGNLKKRQENEIYENGKEMFISNKFVLVRELSPNNFKYIESWHVYSLMSHNMVVAGIVALTLIAIKIRRNPPPPNPEFWNISAGFVTVIIIFFIYNAVKFNIWSVNDHNAAIKKLHLVEQAEKLVAGKKESKKSV